ncbi:hypothetical protein LEP1GSC202_0389 [Leptospira yanagawae serovar Saopaulo str. Sao Paulo = ATCC 700523]|uniref:Uncharacterized protein n=1 Tax=Leptospira yanagawae serovar Saopaulo str. Sao Paulo = ATCC 700523 TaxID=1249483 RepID=A0A5E8HBF8_9LEPT|nr:tetratricopeptide repeat protein [Leptospira yanagawae]EOQ87910.1 hypothetical protein LEP1GSC202_0389 [Leptospira yanagawae serovar Saopaulo str. Sao Paulo = ATCC 700523]
MNRKHLIIISLLLNTALYSDEQEPSIVCAKLVRPEFPAKTVKLLHIDSNVKPGDTVQIGDPAGILLPYPDKISKKFDSNYRKSEIFYYERKYNEALNILIPALKEEKNNPFLLNAYARTLYTLGRRKESFDTYKLLISIIDKDETVLPDGSYENVVIDTYFLEAYWKISTIYLDYQDFKKSIYYNRKMLDVITLGNTYYDPNTMDYNIGAVTFLAEAYYFLNMKNENHFYACETFKLDRNNKYILKFIL